MEDNMKKNRNPYRERNYCEYAEYIDETYICKQSGKDCSLGFFPNCWECNLYKQHKRGIRI